MNFLYESALDFATIIMKPVVLTALVVIAFHLHRKNKNIKKGQKLFVKGYPERALDMTLSSIALGLIFGFVIFLGYRGIVGYVDLSQEIVIMFLISLFASNLASRFICFAYSGSIICLLILLIGQFTATIGIEDTISAKAMSIILLVGILHISEAILVFFDGAKGIVYYYRSTENDIIGGYKLSRRWVIPLLSFLTYTGYSAVSYNEPKMSKVKKSAFKIGIYGICLIFLAKIAIGNYILEIFVAVMMAIGHEYITGHIFNKSDKEKIFISNDGISVLDSLKCGKAREVGIEAADKITYVNNIKTNDSKFLEYIIDNKDTQEVVLTVKKYNGKIEQYELKLESIDELGVVLVPAKNPQPIIKNQENLDFSFEEILKNIEI
ncbi:MAG: hypothetical protein ACRDCW_05345 [Sarcina sp.]